ncbi:hypothetical protein [Sporosarcina sp. SG10008]|uniref:hypothetical protein n=1 Tax=Sporosarcina sp. SG10008 TaxID=3373103 RepID=UPI0037DD299E
MEVINIRGLYDDLGKRNDILDYLDDRDGDFWAGLSLLNALNQEPKHVNEDLKFWNARYFIFGRLINNIAASYELLKMGLEDEFLTMYRQSLENAWLLKYFIEYPDKIDGWIKDGVKPWQRRKAVDGNTVTGRIYGELCDLVHSNRNSIRGVCIGGMYNPWMLNKLFGHLIVLVANSLDYFLEVMSLFNIDLDKENKELSDLLSNEINKLNLCMCVTQYLEDPQGVKEILKNGNEDVIEYLESLYEVVEDTL